VPLPARARRRASIAFEVERARALPAAAAPLVASLRGRARWLVAGFAAGGLATADALARAGFDPSRGAPRPRRRDVLRHALVLVARSAGERAPVERTAGGCRAPAARRGRAVATSCDTPSCSSRAAPGSARRWSAPREPAGRRQRAAARARRGWRPRRGGGRRPRRAHRRARLRGRRRARDPARGAPAP